MSKRSDDYGKKSFKDSIVEKKKAIERKKPVKVLKKKKIKYEHSSTSGAGIIVSLISIFIFAIIATALLPTIANQITLATNQTNMSSTDENLLELLPVFMIVGGLLAILAVVGLS